jgi:hypothetical protein
MYTILGADNREYGPVPAEVVRRWIAERRLDAQSKIRREGDSTWKFLADFPEFQSAPGAASSASHPSGTTPAPTLAGGKRTSGAALSAFVLGLLSPCTLGVLAIPGILVAIVALYKIGRSAGQMTGKKLAIGGLILSVLSLLIIPPLFIVAVTKHRTFRTVSPVDPTKDCINHLQQLANAVRTYANDNNDRFPSANWCDALQSGVNDLTAFQCPARPGLRCGYALNAAVAGKVRYEVAPETVVLFESDQGWNAVGNASALIPNSRHGSISVALANGTVRSINSENVSSLRWTP